MEASKHILTTYISSSTKSKFSEAYTREEGYICGKMMVVRLFDLIQNEDCSFLSQVSKERKQPKYIRNNYQIKPITLHLTDEQMTLFYNLKFRYDFPAVSSLGYYLFEHISVSL